MFDEWSEWPEEDEDEARIIGLAREVSFRMDWEVSE